MWKIERITEGEKVAKFAGSRKFQIVEREFAIEVAGEMSKPRA